MPTWGGALISSAILAVVVLLGWGLLLSLRTPRSDRTWAQDHDRLPSIVLTEEEVVLQGIRDFRYGAGGAEPQARYRDGRFALDGVRRVWFALAPFANRYRGLAHSFVSFEFASGDFLAISVEARREAHEGYSLFGGLLNGFEVAYVMGSERDLLGVRALRGDTLYLYPSVATPDQARLLLVDMLERAHATQEAPEFYHTLFNNCNTNLRDHVNRATTARLPWGWGVLLPGFSDALALRQGLLDTDLPLEEARARFQVEGRVLRALAGEDDDYSRRIRDWDVGDNGVRRVP